MGLIAALATSLIHASYRANAREIKALMTPVARLNGRCLFLRQKCAPHRASIQANDKNA
jgi:hypothetical protein